MKIAIEIDGSQHLLLERKERDEKKDLLLQENGWRVIRIAESVVKTDWDAIQQVLNEYISLGTTMTFTQVGVVTAPKQTYVKVKRDEFGRSEKMIESAIKQRKYQRPDRDTLVKELTETSFAEVSRKYGVDSNIIRKWCVFYCISKYAKDYKKENKS